MVIQVSVGIQESVGILVIVVRLGILVIVVSLAIVDSQVIQDSAE